MNGNTFQLSTNQLDWLSLNYPTVAGQTEGGGSYFSAPSPKSSNAGYSFGPFQFDLGSTPNGPNNPKARDFIKNITLNGQLAFSSSDIIALTQNGGISQSNLTALSNTLAQALQDPANQSTYQTLQSGQLQNLETQVQSAINYAVNNGGTVGTDIANQILNNPIAQLRIMDYANQLPISTGGSLELFLAGNSVRMSATGKTLQVDPSQSLDAQLQTFYQNTIAGAVQTPGRVANLNQGIQDVMNSTSGKISPSETSSLDNVIAYLLGNAQNQISDPLVISMNGQAVTTTSLANGAYVDYQGTGFEEQSSWFSSNAGILVDVTNPAGTLNKGFTIIGSSTTNQNGNVQGQSGFTQLAALDTNHDGVINASDTRFSQIEVWVGSNGQAGSGQLETLAQAGITSISLQSTAVNTTDANGDKLVATSTITNSNGTTSTLSDMNMPVNTSNTIDESGGVINSAYANLPNVANWSDVHNLQVAMAA